MMKPLMRKIHQSQHILAVCCLLPVILFALAHTAYGALNVFPKAAKPPKHLYVINMEGKSYDELVFAATLEGIVNRKEPRLYIVTKEEDPAKFILSIYNEKYGVKSEDVSLDGALAKFKSELKGAILYDASDDFTVNICTTLAGIKDAVCAAGALMPLLEKAGIKILTDLRGKWKETEKYDAYRKIFKTHRKQFSKKAVGVLSPKNWQTRDYLVQNKIFTFFAKALPKQKPLLEELLSAMPDNIGVFGYLSSTGLEELVAVETLSMRNKILVPSDVQSNLSVHSGFIYDGAQFKGKTKTRAIPDIKGKLAVVLALTDGDNVYVPLTYFLQKNYWRNANRGKIPMGWSISQALLDIAPAVAAYYKETATENDELVAMISVGYTHPTYYQDKNWLAEKTLEYVRAFDLTSLWTIDPTLYNPEIPFSQQMLSLFAKPPLTGFLVGYSPATATKLQFITKDNFPLLICRSTYEDNPGILKGYIEKELSMLKEGETRIVFYSLSNWGFDMDGIYDSMKEFLANERVVFLKPTEAFTLLRSSLP